MKSRALPLFLAAFLAAKTGVTDSLSVTTSVANATVRPAVNGQIQVPGLEIETTIRGACDDGREPVSLSMSSADSVQFVDLDTVGTDGAWQTVFSLPASQVPPLVARGFCTTDPTDEQQTAWRKEAFVSLRASFRCAAGEEERLTTRTALVDIDLRCETGSDALNQDSSE